MIYSKDLTNTTSYNSFNNSNAHNFCINDTISNSGSENINDPARPENYYCPANCLSCSIKPHPLNN